MVVEVVAFGAYGLPVPLSTLGDVQDVSWSTGWRNGAPAGCQEASWSIDLPPDATHPALFPGRRVELWDGPARVFTGLLSEPDRGEPWRMHAVGLARTAGGFMCLNSTGGTTSTPDLAVDQAITRGLQWTRPNSLSSAAFVTGDTTRDLNYLPALLDAWAEEAGKVWGVWADGVVFAATDPTTPKWLLTPGAGVMGVADDDFATHVYGVYVSAESGGVPSAWSTATAGDDAAAAKWGRREVRYDMTPLGLMDATRANGLVAKKLTQVAQRMGFTNRLEVTSDELTTFGGVPARLSQVRAGDMLRIHGVLNADGNLTVGGSVDIVIGETRHTDGADTLTIAPVGLVARSLTDLLSIPQDGEGFRVTP